MAVFPYSGNWDALTKAVKKSWEHAPSGAQQQTMPSFGAPPASPAPMERSYAGGGAFGWTPQYGGVPYTADPLAASYQASQGNLANLKGAENLGANINQFQQGQLMGQYAMADPSLAGNWSAGGANIGANLAGEIDPVTMSQLQTRAAERGIQMGSPGSPNAMGYLMASLGRNMEHRQELGQTQLLNRLRSTPIAQPYDITGTMPGWSDIYGARQQANVYAASPIPSMQAEQEQAMALQSMQQGAQMQDWLAQRNFGRYPSQYPMMNMYNPNRMSGGNMPSMDYLYDMGSAPAPQAAAGPTEADYAKATHEGTLAWTNPANVAQSQYNNAMTYWRPPWENTSSLVDLPEGMYA